MAKGKGANVKTVKRRKNAKSRRTKVEPLVIELPIPLPPGRGAPDEVIVVVRETKTWALGQRLNVDAYLRWNHTLVK